MELRVMPLATRRMRPGFDVFDALAESLGSNGANLLEGDVLVVSTKFVSSAQNRIVRAPDIRASGAARDVARRFRLEPHVAEAVMRESDEVFGGIGGFVIASSGGVIAPNAGIDRSNAREGDLILYPAAPYQTAEQLRRRAFLRWQVHIGVILADSRLMPARVGTSGIAVACAGMEPVLDMRGEPDLDGRPLRVTFQAVADSLATIANHRMGEGSESRPFAIVRDSGAIMTDRRIGPLEAAVPPEQCVYVRGLANSTKS